MNNSTKFGTIALIASALAIGGFTNSTVAGKNKPKKETKKESKQSKQEKCDAKTYNSEDGLGSILCDTVKVHGLIANILPVEFDYFQSKGRKGMQVNHPSLRVKFIDDSGNSYDLIYQDTGGIHKGKATISFRPISGGMFQHLDFIKRYAKDRNIGSEHGDRKIYANGIMHRDRIRYDSENENPPKRKKKCKEKKFGQLLNLKKSETVEGTITEVYSSSIPYKLEFEEKFYAGNYPIYWITLQTRDRTLTLLSGYQGDFHKGVAKVKIAHLECGVASSREFIKRYVKDHGKNLTSLSTSFVEADALVHNNGVSYDL